MFNSTQAWFTDEEKKLYIDSYKPSESVMFQDQRDRALEAMEVSVERIQGEFINIFDRYINGESIDQLMWSYSINARNNILKVILNYQPKKILR